MKINEAIKYLERKEEIREFKETELSLEEEEFYTVEEARKIEKVMKEGKIYGDPVVEVDF